MDFKFDDTFAAIKDTDDNLVSIWEAFRDDIYSNDHTLLKDQYRQVFVTANAEGTNCKDPIVGCGAHYLIHSCLAKYYDTVYEDIDVNGTTINMPIFNLKGQTLILNRGGNYRFSTYNYPMGFRNGTVVFTTEYGISWDDLNKKLSFSGVSTTFTYWEGIYISTNLYFENINLIIDSSISLVKPITTMKNTIIYYTDKSVLSNRGAGVFAYNDTSTSFIIDRTVLSSCYANSTFPYQPTIIFNSNPNYKLFSANVIGFISDTNTLTPDTVETCHFHNNINDRVAAVEPNLYADKPLYGATKIKKLAPMSYNVDSNKKRDYIFTDYKPTSLE